jgi:hypothetical protein
VTAKQAKISFFFWINLKLGSRVVPDVGTGREIFNAYYSLHMIIYHWLQHVMLLMLLQGRIML